MRGKRVTEEEYEKIKALAGYGIDNTTISNAVRRSPYIVKAIRESSDYATYKQIIRERVNREETRLEQPTLNIQPKTKDIAELSKIKAQELIDELKLWRSITKNRKNALALLKAEEALMWLNYNGDVLA